MDAVDGAAPRNSPEVRLVDGPSPLSGRLQIRHLGEWHSVCTNSRKYVHFSFKFPGRVCLKRHIRPNGKNAS